MTPISPPSSTPSATPPVALPAELPPEAPCARRLPWCMLAIVALAMAFVPFTPWWHATSAAILLWGLWRLRRSPPVLRLQRDAEGRVSLSAGDAPAVPLAACHLHWLGRRWLLVVLETRDGAQYARLLCGSAFEVAPLPLLKWLSWTRSLAGEREAPAENP